MTQKFNLNLECDSIQYLKKNDNNKHSNNVIIPYTITNTLE